MMPAPAAETDAFWKMSLPAFSVRFPLPPEAVTFAFSVRSSAVAAPSAVSTMSPPPVAFTAWLMVS